MMSNPAFKFDHVHIISENPRASAEWYVEMLGATIAADTIARGAAQIFVELGGMTILIRGRRPGEDPVTPRPIRPYADFSSHNAWGTDHFGFMYQGDLRALCDRLRAKGVQFPVELKRGVNGSLLCYVAAPDGVSIELMEC
jgi:lactoylglutathione lyase